MISLYTSGAAVTMNAGSDGQKYSPPSGYSSVDSATTTPAPAQVYQGFSEVSYSGSATLQEYQAFVEVSTGGAHSTIQQYQSFAEAVTAGPASVQVGQSFIEVVYPGSQYTPPTPAPGTHRYWRVNITNNAYGSYPCIAELAFASSTGGANLLTNSASISASSVNSSGYEAAKAIDGNASTWWNATSGFPGWIEYDFGSVSSAVNVTEVRITARNDSSAGASTAPSSFQLQWSDDNSSWTTAQTFSPATWSVGQTQTFDMPVVASTFRGYAFFM